MMTKLQKIYPEYCRRTKIILIAIIFFGIFGLAKISQAATYYVATTGSDSSSGTSAAPFKTIQKAADIVNAGDTVIVRNGTYTDTNSDNYIVYMTRAGTSGAWITFKAENKWGAVLDGQNNTTDYCVNIGANANYVRLEDFEIKGCTNSGVHSNAGADYVYIYRNKVHDIAQELDCNLDCAGTSTCGNSGMDFGGGGTNHVADSNIIFNIGREQVGCEGYPTPPGTPDPIMAFYNHDHGIYNRIDGTIITNNIIYDVRSGYSVKVTDDNNVKIVNNTFAGHGVYMNGAIEFQGANSGIIIENNIGYNVGDRFVHNPVASGCDNDIATVRNNLTNASCLTYCGSCFSSKAGWTFANNISNQDPQFINSSNKDFHLLSISPAIDKGLTYSGRTVDADGKSIVGAPDIGAYEYRGGTSDTTAPAAPSGLIIQ
jgi:hypothetical protein